MKKNVLLLAACGAFAVASLASCSKATQSYADKIDKAAEQEKYVTYEDAKKALGDECIDVTLAQTGVLVAVKGCKTKEDIQKKLDEGKDVKGIIITVVLGKCTDAEYTVIKAEDLKSK